MTDPVRQVHALESALRDALSALDYVRFHYGDLYGVGFDRVRNAGDAALEMGRIPRFPDLNGDEE